MSQKSPPKQLNFKVSSNFYWKLKNFASSKRLKMSEVLEKAFEFYQQKEAIVKEINLYRQTIPTIEKQMQSFLGSMNLMELGLRIKSLNPEYFNRLGLVITYQVVKESLSECLRLESRSLK